MFLSVDFLAAVLVGGRS